MIISNYFLKGTIKSLLVTVIALVTLLQLADIFTVLWPKLNDGFTAMQILHMSFLNLGLSINKSLGFGLLFSGAYSLGNFMATGQLIAAKCCGISTFTLVKPFILMSVMLMVLQLVAINPLSEFNSQRVATLTPEQVQTRSDFSYRWDFGLFYSERYNSVDQVFFNVLIVEVDGNHNLKSRMNAQTARWQNNAWHLTDVRFFYPHHDPVYYSEFDYVSAVAPTPTTISSTETPPTSLSLKQLRENIAFLKDRGFPYYTQQMVYYRYFNDPLQTLLFGFFPLIVHQTRKNSMLNSLIQSVGLAVILFILQMLFNIIGESNRMPALVAVILPSVLMVFTMLVASKVLAKFL